MTSQPPAVEPGAGGDAGPASIHAYDAFLSYSNRTDYSTARQVEAFLEGFHKEVPRAETPVRRLQVCRDGSDFKLPEAAHGSLLVGEDPIWRIIVGELSRARYLLVLCSPGAAESPWVAREVEWMLANGDASRILLAVTECEDPVGNPAACFPPRVIESGIHASRIWYDLRGLHPVRRRRNVRDERDELVRLATDLLDWDAVAHGSLSAVFEREQRRRRRARLAVTVGAALLLAVSVFAAVNWWLTADREARKAESRRLALNAMAQIIRDSELALLLAVEAREKFPTEEAEEALRQAVLRSRTRATLRLPQPQRRDADEYHVPDIAGAKLSPDGRYLVVNTGKGPVRVWDVAEGREKFALPSDYCYFGRVSFSPDGGRILTACGEVRVWSAADGGLLFELPGVTTSQAEFSPDGTRLVTADVESRDVTSRLAAYYSRESVAKFWNASDGSPLGGDIRTPGHGFKVATLSPDNRFLVTVEEDSPTPQVWDVATRSLLTELKGHIDNVRSVTFDLGGRRLLTAGRDRTAIVWDAKTWEELTRLTRLGNYVEIGGAAFSPDGSTVVTTGETDVIIWDAASGRRVDALVGHKSPTRGAAFSRDGKQVVTWDDDDAIRVWWARVDGERAPLRPFEHATSVRDVAFSPDGKRLLTSCADGSVWVWGVETGAGWTTEAQPGLLRAAFSDDRHFKTFSLSGEIRFWDVETHLGLRSDVIAQPGAITDAAFGPGARLLAALGKDGAARVWDAETGEPLGAFRPGRGRSGEVEDKFTTVFFSPDGRPLARSEGGEKVKLWEIEAGKKVLELPKGSQVESVAPGPGGGSLLISDAGRLALWRAEPPGPTHVLRDYSGSTGDAAFSPDGKLVVTVGQDGTGTVWEVSSGERLITLRGVSDWVDAVAFSPDGTLIAAAGRGKDAGKGGTAQVFACEVCASGEALVRLARLRVTRELTAAERRTFALE